MIKKKLCITVIFKHFSNLWRANEILFMVFDINTTWQKGCANEDADGDSALKVSLIRYNIICVCC